MVLRVHDLLKKWGRMHHVHLEFDEQENRLEMDLVHVILQIRMMFFLNDLNDQLMFEYKPEFIFISSTIFLK
jgi:hypothetical protein